MATLTAMKFQEFQNSVRKEKLAPVYLFSGEETGLIDEGVAILLEKLVSPETRDFNFDVFYGGEVAASHIVDIAASYPSMAPHRTVLVRDIHKMSPGDLAVMVKHVKRQCPTTYLILVEREKGSRKKGLDELRKLAAMVECRPLYDNQVVPWIHNYASRLGMKIAAEAAQILATEVGNSTLALRSELEKTRLYVGDGKEVTAEHVQEIAGFRREFSVFSLQDAAGEKNVSAALRILDSLALHSGASAIISSLARYYGHLYVAKALPGRQDVGKLSEVTGVQPFFAERLQKSAKGYELGEIFNAYEVLQHADYVSKTQAVSDLLLLRLTIIAIIKNISPRYMPFPRNITDGDA